MSDPAYSDFLDKLQKIYDKDQNLRQYWSHERAALQEIIPEIAKALAFNYELADPLGVGGSGIVAKVRDKNLQLVRALKVSRPSPGKEELLAGILLSETKSLLRLSHQNLIKIYAQGVAEHKDNNYPYYVMDFVEGVLDADEFLHQKNRTEQDVFSIFLGTLNAV